MQESFKGEVIHTSEFINAKNNAGKKVVIIGAATSAHDVAADHVLNGVGEVVRRCFTEPNRSNALTYFEDDVSTAANTCDDSEEWCSSSHSPWVLVPLWSWEVLILSIAYREGGPPPAIPDLITNSLPRLVLRSLMQGLTRYIGHLDKCV